MIIRINPLDTFFFRDGKPFEMGDEAWADGIFPPSPSVIYGALRSLWISQQEGGFTKENIEKSEKLVINKILLQIGESILFPIPNDFVHEKNKPNNKFLLCLDTFSQISSYKMENCLTPPNKEYIKEFDKSCLLGKDDFVFYTKNKRITNIQPIKNYFISESKIGIARDNRTHTSDNGKLYRVDMKRFTNPDTKILVDFEGLTFENLEFAKIGGEGKLGYITQGNEISTEAPQIENNIFKVYLATPAIFENGWLPNWIDTDNLSGFFPETNIKLKLLTASLSKSISIGGFDVKAKSPKKMYKAVGAGSVYYFELLEGDSALLVSCFHEKTISDVKANEGFGLAYLSTPNIKKIKI